MESKFEIYIAAHKEFNLPKLDGYHPISVGTKLRNGNNFGYISDAEGENISEKNNSFCELTALYWIWKNALADIVGLVHYRRYFSCFFYSENPQYYLTKGKAEHILKCYDIILPERIKWKYCTVAEGYDHGAGYGKDLKVIEEIISRMYPEYLNVFRKVCNGHEASYCNMFVAKKVHIDKYCTWLFDILFEAERIIDISDYGPAEKRIFGYISEILLNVWVIKNDLRTYNMPVVWVTGKQSKRNTLYYAIEHLPYGRHLIRMINDYEFNKAQRW